MEGGSGGWRREKTPVFKLEASLNWWAPGAELFCREIICIMGKWLKLELRTLLLWGQSVSEVEEENYLIEDQYQGALRGRCITVICSLASCHLPISSAKQFTNNLSDVRCRSVLMNLLLKRLHRNCSVFIRLMNLTQCNIFQPTYYDKKKDDWLENWNSAKYNFEHTASLETQASFSFSQMQRLILLYCKTHTSCSFNHETN